MAIRMPKRTQHCTFCKNHAVNIPKKGHHCPHQNCSCLLCKLTKKAQVAMRHQQRVWRHQKQKLKSQKFDTEEFPSTAGEPKPSKSQACDKCRNHNILKMKRNHQCPFQTCQCEYCSLTFKRREIMKHQQRVRRSRITSQVESDGGPSAGEEPEEEEGEYSYFQEEVSENLAVRKMNEDVPNDYHDIGSSNSQALSGINREIQLNEDEIKEDEMLPNNYSLRSTPNDSDHFHHKTSFPSEENYSPQRQDEEDLPRESPPPLIHMTSDKSSLYHSFSRENGSESPATLYNHNSLSALSMRDCSPRQENTPPPRPFQFESLKEEPKEDFQSSSLLLFQRETSASLRSFPFPAAQPLERLTALNASLDPTFKFGNPFDTFRFRNCGFLPSALLESSFRNISPTTSSLLRPHYHYQHLERTQTNQPIRPLPLNFSHPRHPGNFPQHLWNQMLLPFNFGIHQNVSESNLMRFQSIASTRFSPRDLFHPV